MKQERSKKDFLNDKKSKQQKKKLKYLFPLPADVIKTLRQKRPDPKPSNDTMLHGPSNHVNDIIFDEVNGDLLTRTKGSHGPSGLMPFCGVRSYVIQPLEMHQMISVTLTLLPRM